MRHVNQLGHISKTPLSLLEIHEISAVDTSKSKEQNSDQIWHMQPPYQKLLGLSHISWLSHSPIVDCPFLFKFNNFFIFIQPQKLAMLYFFLFQIYFDEISGTLWKVWNAPPTQLYKFYFFLSDIELVAQLWRNVCCELVVFCNIIGFCFSLKHEQLWCGMIG